MRYMSGRSAKLSTRAAAGDWQGGGSGGWWIMTGGAEVVGEVNWNIREGGDGLGEVLSRHMVKRRFGLTTSYTTRAPQQSLWATTLGRF
jgi:hypothetical protein